MGFSPDDRIGSYRVETVLGQTGWGILLQARHVVLPRLASIKVVHTAFAAMQPYVLQTLREACILEAVAHPGVPIVYESGVLRDRRPWFAFELIAGPTLEELLAPGPVSVIEVAGLLRDLSEILEHAHRHGVIHCGLRPDRIVITNERRYPLCIPDWSEAIAHDASTRAAPAVSEGSPSYFAPELARDEAGSLHERIDDRADMFALGVIAYRALTGGLPFGSGHDAASYVPAHELRSDVPPELAAIIDSLLAFNRFDRPSASEVRANVDWLFEALPHLRVRAASNREPRLAIVQGPLESAGDPREAASASQGDAGSLPEEAGGPQEDVVLLDQPRLRRPRWTPDVRYLDTPHVDIEITEHDRTK